MTLRIVPNRSRWYLCSGALVLVSVLAMVIWHFNFGIDFTGGSLVELSFTGERPAPAVLAQQVESLGATRVLVQTAGDRSAIIRTASMAPEVHEAILREFAGTAREDRFETIGPTIGRELARKTITGIVLALLAIVGYVAWTFRKAGRDGVPSWAYGVVALIAMAHDVLIPMGVFAVLGAFRGVEVDAPFIAAVLTILGYSINDTIIVLDRIRENLASGGRGKPFPELVELSVHQSFARSMNTTLTTLLALLAVVLFGGATVRFFALALMIGIAVGAYSSIFVAAPLLVTWQGRRK